MKMIRRDNEFVQKGMGMVIRYLFPTLPGYPSGAVKAHPIVKIHPEECNSRCSANGDEISPWRSIIPPG
jgi:hypothetical protein